MRFIVTLVFSTHLAGLSAIAANPQPAFSAPQSSTLISRGYDAAQLAMTSLAEWKMGPDKRCIAQSATTASDAVSRLNGFSEGTRTNFPDLYASMAPIHSSLQLDLADEFLKQGCLDQADRLYRAVIRIHIGSRFAAERQRAQIGIDDVRAKRASQ